MNGLRFLLPLPPTVYPVALTGRHCRVIARPARPFDWSLDDAEVALDDTPAHGIERPAS